MHAWYLLSVWLHILSAAIWIGGMAFLGLVLVPVIRRSEFSGVRTALLYQTGLRFRWAGWIVFGLLVLTGITNLGFRGFTWNHLWSGGLWDGGWGHVLGTKVVLVLVVLVLSAAHDFYIGPRAARLLSAASPGTDREQMRRVASYVGRVMLLLSLVILALAVMLVRGW